MPSGHAEDHLEPSISYISGDRPVSVQQAEKKREKPEQKQPQDIATANFFSTLDWQDDGKSSVADSKHNAANSSHDAKGNA